MLGMNPCLEANNGNHPIHNWMTLRIDSSPFDWAKYGLQESESEDQKENDEKEENTDASVPARVSALVRQASWLSHQGIISQGDSTPFFYYCTFANYHKRPSFFF